jgi:hypothetical protein
LDRPGGQTLAASFDLGTLLVWDVRSQRELAHREIEATSLASSRDGRILAIGDECAVGDDEALALRRVVARTIGAERS